MLALLSQAKQAKKIFAFFFGSLAFFQTIFLFALKLFQSFINYD